VEVECWYPAERAHEPIEERGERWRNDVGWGSRATTIAAVASGPPSPPPALSWLCRRLTARGGMHMPAYDRRELAAIFVGGAIGALVRAAVSEALPHTSAEWPWATFVVNVLGAFLLGYFATRLQERLPLSAYRRPFLGTGICGALTTFSTMQVELLRMLDRGQVALAAGYAAASVAAGFLAVWAATAITRRVRIVL
jgi:CrcB protein